MADGAVAAAGASSRGQMLPKAEFIEDVAAFVEGKDVDSLIAKMREDLSTLRMVERDLFQKRLRLNAKLPEMQRALEIVRELIERRERGDEVVTDFMLAEGVYAKAKVKEVQAVSLWLGANVMVEYPLDQARDLLEQNQSNCRQNLKTNEEDLAYVKDSVTTTEVSIARIFNYDVERRRKAKEGGGDAA